MYSNILASNEFETYLNKYNSSYDKFNNSTKKEYSQYLKIYKESAKEYKQIIKKHWKEDKVSSEHIWIEYSNNYQNRISIDYQNKQIIFEVIATSQKNAQQKIVKLFRKLNTYTFKTIIKNDVLLNKIAFKLATLPYDNKISEQKIISDTYNKLKEKKVIDQIIREKFALSEFNEKKYFKSIIKLPKNFRKIKSIVYKDEIQVLAKKYNLPIELIHAIIENESSFNPMARSTNPSFGLMQVNLDKSVLEAYNYLYGYNKLLPLYELYDTSNNILLGSTYLHLIMNKTLKNITNEKNRIYCTIIAYNIGIDNLVKIFTEDTNINKSISLINSMNSPTLYKKLLKKLPSNESKKYLFQVLKSMTYYKKNLKDDL